MKTFNINKILVLIIISLVIFSSNNEIIAKAKVKKRGKSKKVKVVPVFDIIKNEELGNGLNYKNIIVGTNKLKHSVHILELNTKSEDFKINVLKAKNLNSELEKLHSMANVYDSLNDEETICIINANFWKSYTNNPIGATVIDGEVVEMNPYKEWTSGFFDLNQQLHIDNFKLSAQIKNKQNQILPISHTNRRKDSAEIVLYNKFGGDTIPFISHEKFSKLRNEMFLNAMDTLMINDSTEAEFEIDSLENLLRENQRSTSIENNSKKYACIYLDNPIINRTIKIKVIAYESSKISVPQNGLVISFGNYDLSNFNIKIGDTLDLLYKTNTNQNILFKNAVCGTPRLVRRGLAKHEARLEGSKGRRFINKTLPRTAIGTDKSGKKVYLVVIEPDGRWKGIRGASLQNLSNTLKKIGCYDAMNLDGGGSTTMLINNSNVMYKSRPDWSRKVAVGLSISKKKGV